MAAVDPSLGLIGREHPAALLRAEIARGVESHGGLVLVTGEAGIGKTTLVTGAAEEARRLGALVLGGSCWDSGSAPGYWFVRSAPAFRPGAKRTVPRSGAGKDDSRRADRRPGGLRRGGSAARCTGAGG